MCVGGGGEDLVGACVFLWVWWVFTGVVGLIGVCVFTGVVGLIGVCVCVYSCGVSDRSVCVCLQVFWV